MRDSHRSGRTLKLWLKDTDLASNVGLGLVELITSKTNDVLARRSAKRQFESIGDHVAETILPLFEAENVRLDRPEIESVILTASDTITNLQPIAQLVNIHTLDLRGCMGVTDLSAIGEFPDLRNLTLWDCSGITSISPIRGVTGLGKLDLENCGQIVDLDLVSNFEQLRWLDLSGQ